MNFHGARLGFEAQNTMAFRLLKVVRGIVKPSIPDVTRAEMALLKLARVARAVKPIHTSLLIVQ
jgi:hypothetical protein